MDFNEIITKLPEPYYRDNQKDIVIYCADCRDILKKIPDRCIDLVLTDPPYGIGIASNPFRQKHAKSNWDEKPIDKDLLDKVIEISDEQVIWGGNYFDLPQSKCFFIWDKLQPQNFSSAMCEMAWVSKDMPAKMYKKWVVDYEKWHPTQKPHDLMVWCLEFFPEAQTILDPFLGSGTTAVACKVLGRKCIGIEISEKYCEIAKKRLAQGVLL